MMLTEQATRDLLAAKWHQFSAHRWCKIEKECAVCDQLFWSWTGEMAGLYEVLGQYPQDVTLLKKGPRRIEQMISGYLDAQLDHSVAKAKAAGDWPGGDLSDPLGSVGRVS